jgi:hypothetical protein
MGPERRSVDPIGENYVFNGPKDDMLSAAYEAEMTRLTN